MTIRLIEFEDYYINPDNINYIGQIRQSVYLDARNKPSYYYAIHLANSETIKIAKDTEELTIASRKELAEILISERK